eukprot:93801_1
MTITTSWWGADLCMKGYLPLGDTGSCNVQILRVIDDEYHTDVKMKWLIGFWVFIFPLFVSCVIGSVLSIRTIHNYQQKEESSYEDRYDSSYTTSSLYISDGD